MAKTCGNCKFWNGGHSGFWNTDVNGNCKIIDTNEVFEKNSGIVGLMEGCVNVIDKIDTFELITQINFGCIHFKQTKK